MTQIGEAFVRVRPDTRGFERDTERQVGGAVRGASSTLRRTAGTLLAAGGIVGGVTLISQAVRGAVSEFSEATKVAAQTNAVLESTQGVANVTAREVDQLASSLMGLTGVDDEVIKQGENILLTFTKVRNEVGKGNDVFSQATELALDLSIALRTSMSGAALQLGKALNDPVRGMTALRRAGVAFTEEQQKQIKALVKSGDLLSAQKMILAELRVEFGGTAKEIGQTLPGQIELLKNQVDELGGAIIGNLAPQLEDVVRRTNDWLASSENQERIVNDVTAAVEAGADVVRGFAEAIQLVGKVVGPVVSALGGLENAAKLALLVGIVLKVKAAAASVGLIATAFSLTSKKVIGDAAVMGRAIDVATRPRTVVITTTSTGPFVPGKGGKGAAPLPGKAGKIPPIGFTPTAIAATLGIIALNAASGSAAQLTGFGEPIGRTPEGALVYRSGDGSLWVVGKGAGSRTVRGPMGTPVTLIPYRPTAPTGRRPEEGVGRGLRGPKRTRETAVKAAAGKPTPKPLTIGEIETRLTRFEEQKVDAELRGSVEAQRRVLRAERAFLTAQIKTARITVDERLGLKRELLDIQGELERIADDTTDATTSAVTSRVAKQTSAIDARLAAFAERKLDATLRGDSGAKVLRAEEDYLRAQIKRYRDNVTLRRKLKEELKRVLDEIDALTKDTSRTAETASTRATDRSASLLSKLRADDRERRAQAAREGITLGEVIAREERSGTTTTAGTVSTSRRSATGTTVDAAEVPSLDFLLREIANGQARRDSLQLAATQETNRLLRTMTVRADKPAPPRAPDVQPDDVPAIPGNRARMKGL